MTTCKVVIVGFTEFLRIHVKGNQYCEQTITDASPAYRERYYELCMRLMTSKVFSSCLKR